MLDLQGTNDDDFASLSLKDLLEARDTYHFHLINKANVVGTAIGRYLQHKDPARRHDGSIRTLENSQVLPNSWPCVLVFVSKWEDEASFAKGQRFSAYDMVPKALFLPDGRRVPVCVVAAQPVIPTTTVPNWLWPASSFGPGYPIAVDHQGLEHIGSIGCLVSDGHTTYALTSRHVCGQAGTPLYSYVRGRRVKIGTASGKQVTRLPFAECYPDLPARRTFINLDVGLCELDDLTDWRARIFGLPAFGATAELNEANIRLRLIDAKVCATGAASGALRGRIAALFYRYKAVAGFDYVADFMIMPDGPSTRGGDSGTVWHLMPKHADELLRPIAVEWGGQAFASQDTAEFSFTLATSLSSICKQLDVDVVREDDTSARPLWGQTGHYDIATFAVGLVKEPKLQELMRKNLDRVSFPKDALDAETLADALKHAKETGDFIPLADVPDIIWKNSPHSVVGGRDTQVVDKRPYGPEHPTHFADIDEPIAARHDKTIRQLSLASVDNVTVAAWQTFYDELGHETSGERGLLPFRVWQHFDAMVAAAKKRDPLRFLAAAGILCHYVGDACQPLHGSMYADGYKDQPVTITHHKRDTGEPYTEQSHVGAGVHSCYESKMVDRFSDKLLRGIATELGRASPHIAPIATGQDAAVRTIELMDRAATLIPPTELVDSYVEAGGKNTVPVQEALWQRWGGKTAKTMANGARLLAFIWEAAWEAGNGKAIPKAAIGPLSFDDLYNLYTDTKFLPSLDLDHIGKVLR